MMKITRIVWVILLLVLLSVSAAWARLAVVGPINPNNGFPLYYVDTNGVAVWLPPPLPWDPSLPPAPTLVLGTPPLPYTGGPFGLAIGKQGVATPPSMIFFPPTLTNPFSVQIGFDQECFYWSCQDAGKVTTNFGKLTFQLSLEASFNVLPIANATDGQQTLFSRLRFKSTTLPAGTYTLSHPYGVEILTAGSSGGINFTRDTPLLAPLNFTSVLNSGDVGPFLRQLDPPPVITAGTQAPFDTGWLGDGVTPCTITGSPTGFNQVRLDAPTGVNLDGAGNNFIIITQFIVSGHQYPSPIPTPETLNRVTYTRSRSATFFDVFATSATGAKVTARIPGRGPVPMTEGLNQFAGLFYTRANYVNAATRSMRGNLTNPSASASVTSQFTTLTPTTLTQLPVDQVMITRADWSATTGLLTVAAKSTDGLLLAPLNVVNPSLGALGRGTGSFICPIPPAMITVASSAGGVATKAVRILP